MYINNKELSAFEFVANMLQTIVDNQRSSQNELFPEGIFAVQETLNELEKISETIRHRAVVQLAKKIVKSRGKL